MLRRTAIFALLALTAGSALALYDRRPDDALAAAQGEWRGSLTYRDYSKPDRIVTFPTRLFVAPGGPTELVLHFVFDDGPSKTVSSCERMCFDFQARQMSGSSGDEKRSVDTHTLTARGEDNSTTTLDFARPLEGKIERHILVLSAKQTRPTQEDMGPSGGATLRNRYEFSRTGV